jgi:hypothetical protein
MDEDYHFNQKYGLSLKLNELIKDDQIVGKRNLNLKSSLYLMFLGFTYRNSLINKNI